MSEIYAADYSFARPDPDALYRAGYRVVLRYLGNDARCITRPELRRLHDAGLQVALIGQSTVTRPRAGYRGGVEDANRYNSEAAELDAPDWLPIFYVCDVGHGFPAVSDYGAIRDYTTGILNTPGRPVGQYGPYPVLEMLRDLEVNGRRIECWWQCAGGSGFGFGTGGSYQDPADALGARRRVSSLACMVQQVPGYGVRGDISPSAIDHNQILSHPVTWAWHPDMLPAQYDASPPPQEDDMKSVIVHVDANQSPRIRALLNDPDTTHTDLAFLCMGDWTMKQVTGEEIPKYQFYGVADRGFINDDANWWDLFSLRDRDRVAALP